MKTVVSFCAVAFLAIVTSIHTFNSHVATEGPVRMTIGEIEDVTEYDVSRNVDVALHNMADLPLLHV